MQAEVKDAFWAVFDTEDLQTPPGPQLVEIIQARIDEFAAKYRALYPAAVKCLLAYREGLTAYLRFPAEHHNRIRHSNFIERTFGETRRRSRTCAARCSNHPASCGHAPSPQPSPAIKLRLSGPPRNLTREPGTTPADLHRIRILDAT